VDETAMTGLKVDQPARVVFRSASAKSCVGEVARLGREADRETREFVVDVRVKELPERWTIGQRAEVFIETGHKSGVAMIPQSYVLWREGKPGVFVNDHGKARWHDFTAGIRGLKDIEVTQGLSAGEQIVKPPVGQKLPLAEGQRISVP
jgi:HlyD family secretion protein